MGDGSDEHTEKLSSSSRSFRILINGDTSSGTLPGLPMKETLAGALDNGLHEPSASAQLK